MRAQSVRVQAWLDTTSLRIGEQTSFHLSVQHMPDIYVQFPFIADSLTRNVEVIECTPIDSTVQANGSVRQTQTVRITSFDEGDYTLPPLTFVYRIPNDTTTYTLQTDTIKLLVIGEGDIIPAQKGDSLDAEGKLDIRDIKPPLSVPRTFWEVAPYLVAGVILLGGIVWGVWYYRKHCSARQGNIPAVQAPMRPPYEVAMERLELLQQQQLWQRGEAKEYHTQISDILRVYIQSMYGVHALETTTEEILDALGSNPRLQASTKLLRNILTVADAVKFARYHALPEEHEQSLRLAMEYVQMTALAENIAQSEET
ncbi:MAG: hypothetical protein RML40_05225 [Bacteroidota bacterium]|nr:hypothetical protein [Bacteroidota bacterium]